MKYLRAKGFQIIVLAPETENEWKDKFKEHEIEYRHVDMSKNSANPFDDIHSYFAIKKQLKQLKPDAVICDHAKMIVYGTLAAKACHVNSRFVIMGGVGSVLRDSAQTLKRKIIQKVLKMEYRMSVPRADKVFFQNPDDAALFRKLKFIKEGQAVMVPGSGINLKEFPDTSMPKNHEFLFVGRLIRDKGLMEYMEAGRIVRKTVPDAHFHVIGYFDQNQTMLQMEDLQPYIDDGTVIYHGFQKNVLPFLQESFAFALPSYHEGTPHSTLEAMAVGRPVITTDAPGCRETVVDGENGYLVPVKDTEKLAEAMLELCKDREKAEQMGKASRRMAGEKFDVQIVCNIQYETIQKVLNHETL